jgi:hypothetical protein
VYSVTEFSTASSRANHASSGRDLKTERETKRDETKRDVYRMSVLVHVPFFRRIS